MILPEEMTLMEQSSDVQDVRVVHFGLGTLGAAIARAVSGREGLVSVAAVDPVSGRDGRELADVAGLGAPSGIVVEASAARLGDIEADVVLFAPEGDLEAATTDLELLLEVGLNVVAILPELAYAPDDDDDDLAISVDTLAREAEVTALALDPSDALLGTLPLTLTGICSRVDRLTVRRRGDLSPRARLTLGDWARMLAAALGWALDDFDESEEDDGGRARAVHRVVGSTNGRVTLVVEVAADTSGEPSLEVEIEGTPSLRMTVTGGQSAEDALATLAVNAIPAVLTSDPGLYTLADLPPIHCWTSLGLMPADDDEDLDFNGD
jgi:4-hydroxy-tetrahydrodipicolinate reductase